MISILDFDYKTFVGEVAKVKKQRGLTNRDLAEMTEPFRLGKKPYVANTIATFMAKPKKGREPSRFVAVALSQALDIKIQDVDMKGRNI